MRRPNPSVLAAIALGLIVLVAAIVMTTRRGNSDQDKLSDEQAAGVAASGTQGRCASQTTYDRIKADLFRQAAVLRKSDQAAFDRLSAYASVRMERPLLRGGDEALGTVRCSGRLSLDLPPGVAVVGGRRTLSADIDYVLQPAADGSGDVVMIEGADPIVVPLATLARTGEPAPLPTAPAQLPGAQSPLVPIPDVSAPAAGESEEPARPAIGDASPSFNCHRARTRSEIAVCQDPRLAALDRQMASQFSSALAAAGPRQRATLTSTRDSFLRYRDQCPSNGCIAETYRGRMREIRDIMSGDWRPAR